MDKIGLALNTTANGEPDFSGPSQTHKRTPDGSIWIVDENGAWYLHSGLAMPIALSYQTAFLGSNVTLTDANTFYEVLGIELIQGTWKIDGSFTVISPENTAMRVTWKLIDGVGDVMLGSGEATLPAMGASTTGLLCLPVGGITPAMPLEGAPSLWVASSAAASVVRAAVPDNAGGDPIAAGNTATRLSAVRIVTADL